MNTGIIERLRAFWEQLNQTQRILTIGLGVVALAALIFMMIGSRTPEYAVVYRNLADEDAAAVVDTLAAVGIPYQVGTLQNTISVPQQRVADARLKVAQQGLPKGSVGTGYELLDGGQLGGMGETEFTQHVKYQRALEGELARSISGLEPIQAARVHIVLPEKSLFIDQERSPTASVILQVAPGQRLNRNQVRAISYLVASSVEGMSTENVTIVDVSGNILASGDGDSADAIALQASSNHMEMERSYEKEAEARLLSTLERVLGPGKAVASVDATFNWDQIQMSSETYEPGNGETGVVRSSQTTQEQYVGDNSQIGGIPGVDSNTPGTVPGYPSIITGNTAGYVRSNTTFNFEPSKTLQTTIKAPGTIEQISVAVLVDDTVPAEQMPTLQAMVTAAIGADATRSDTIIVEQIAFNRSMLEDEAKALADQQRWELISQVAKLLAVLTILILAFWFVRGLFRDLSRNVGLPATTVVEEPALAGALSSGGQQAVPMQQISDAYEAASAAMIQATDDEDALFDPDELEQSTEEALEERIKNEQARRRARRQREAILLARRNPELVANVLRSWITS